METKSNDSSLVRLISHSHFCIPESESGGAVSTLTEQVAYMARVSNPDNQNNLLTSEKLIRFLISQKHWSPLEMVNIVLQFDTTRDILQQIVRHRSMSFQVFSLRYQKVQALGSKIQRETRLQDNRNRQNSFELDPNDEKVNELDQWFKKAQETSFELCNSYYNEALEKGIAKEQARIFLQEGLTPTRLFINGNLRSWAHYIEERTKAGVQKEHRELAKAAANAIFKVFPMIMEFVEKPSDVLQVSKN